MPQTLHNWVSEELAGRSSTAALLSAEGNQEERCKQVEPRSDSQSQHDTMSTHCPACPVPNQHLRDRENSSVASLTHLLPFALFCCNNLKNQSVPCKSTTHPLDEACCATRKDLGSILMFIFWTDDRKCLFALFEWTSLSRF